jgi:hypothetical protein
MAALANGRQKPGSAARAPVGPDIHHADRKHAATNRSLVAMSFPCPIPPSKLASPAKATKCCKLPAASCARALILQSVFLACHNQNCRSDRFTGLACFAIATSAPAARHEQDRMRTDSIRRRSTGCFAGNADTAEHQCDASRSAPRLTIPRAPQDGRMTRRCYSSRTSLLSAVRTRIERLIPSTSPHIFFPRAARSS